LQQADPDLRALDVRVVVVTFEPGALARAYLDETRLPWPVLIDADRALYRAYGMLRASAWDVWGPPTLWAYLKELLRGRLPRPTGGDVHQRGGDVLIDPGGVVRLRHAGRGPSDRPSVGALLACARRI
jgi:hypothetical protein